MSFGQGIRHLHSELESLIQTQSLARDQQIQRFARHEFHHDKVSAPLASDIMNRNDVRVAKSRCRTSRLEETALAVRITCSVRWQYLDGDKPIQSFISRLIHDTHAAFTQQ